MNAERKWTPGPWEIGDLDAAGQRMVRQEHIEICTCWHHGVGSIEKEMEANAHLIAAAPDMYEALAMLDKWFTPSGSSVRARWERIPPEECAAIVNATRAALSKAEGR